MNTAAVASKDIEVVKGSRSTRPAPPEMRRALDVIATSCSSPDLAFGDVAHDVNISERHLRRLFAQHLGFGFRQDVRELRLKKAADLLATSSYSIKQIVGITGYLGPSHLSYDFRARFGTTPYLYRA